jgi:ferredoxin
MKTYKVELINRSNFVVEVAEDEYILAAVEAAGLKLPVGCRYGACITCAARLVEGKVEQSKAVALKSAQELYINPFKAKLHTVRETSET